MVRQLFLYSGRRGSAAFLCRGILFDPGCQFYKELDHGEYSKPGIDVYMTVFLIPVIGAESEGAIWDQGAVLFAGKQYCYGTPGLGPAKDG